MKIHQVKTRLVNSYVIEYAERLLVMDVAVGCHEYVLGFIAHELQRDIRAVELVICSHDDADHIGGVAALAAACDAPVGIPYASGSAVRKMIHDPAGGLVRTATSIREMFRWRAWEMYLNPKRKQAAAQKSRLELSATDKHMPGQWHKNYSLKHRAILPGFSDWQVIHTPGHSWDSCCYFHRDSRSLLSGDTLLGSAPLASVVTPSIYSNPWHMRGSLVRLQQLDIATVYPGHGSIICGDRVVADVIDNTAKWLPGSRTEKDLN